jgi:hypothetical protein
VNAGKALTVLCREQFSWNTRHESPEVEAGYTLFLYEQMRAILYAMDQHGFDAPQRMAVFRDNTERILRKECLS